MNTKKWNFLLKNCHPHPCTNWPFHVVHTWLGFQTETGEIAVFNLTITWALWCIIRMDVVSPKELREEITSQVLRTSNVNHLFKNWTSKTNGTTIGIIIICHIYPLCIYICTDVVFYFNYSLTWWILYWNKIQSLLIIIVYFPLLCYCSKGGLKTLTFYKLWITGIQQKYRNWASVFRNFNSKLIMLQ